MPSRLDGILQQASIQSKLPSTRNLTISFPNIIGSYTKNIHMVSFYLSLHAALGKEDAFTSNGSQRI